MKKYVGVKIIEAETMAKDGIDGYKVVYDNPNNTKYESWSPKEVFEKAYTEISEDNRLVREKICEIFEITNDECRTFVPQGYIWKFLNLCEKNGITFDKNRN